jgi:undecaprenyl-diphosphatase
MSVLLGFIQGVAEFLPISSSGHLSILQNIFSMGGTEQEHLFFDVLLHFGTLISIFIAFWKDIVEMIREFFLGLRTVVRPGRDSRRPPPARRMVLLIIF